MDPENARHLTTAQRIERPDGGPVFGDDVAWEGLSVRDWFAAQVITGMLMDVGRTEAPEAAARAYAIADAMLVAREQ